MRIEELPDFPALSQLASALWRDGSGRGAAVLVGAGFSRNAGLSGADTPEPPLWSEISLAMATRLYGLDPAQATADPLRLAEEFKSFLGEAALTELIRRLVPDTSWYPGPMHRKLMALPWSDVLTTNWDTLLERTARNMPVVKNAADLPHARSPRIVKLHGTIQDAGSLVLTEEDYRHYPVRHAAFVNLARQVFLENELCLVGFSGEDPNFLQWSGWVRDNLGGGARRIYLVGALGLGPAKRRLLESRNVAPIDFSPILDGMDAGDKPAKAMAMFIEFLSSAKPKHRTEWEISEGSSYAGPVPTPAVPRPAVDAAALDKIAAIWRSDRERCPAWLVCPSDRRQSLKFATANAPSPYWNALDTLPAESRAKFLYELSWRHSAALWPVEPELLRRVAGVIEQAPSPALSRAQRLWLAGFTLTEARLARDWETYDAAAAVVSREAATGSDEHAGLVFQRALRAYDDLDLQEASKAATSIDGPDPSWKLRRAALQFELGEFDAAEDATRLAVKELDDRLIGDPQSVWVSTRRAWAAVAERAIDIRESGFSPYVRQVFQAAGPSYDPEEEMDGLRREAAREVRELGGVEQDFEPSFGAGTYKDNTTIVRLTGFTEVTAADTLERLLPMAGLPTRTDGVDILAGCARDAARASFEPTLAWYLFAVRSFSSYSDPLMEFAFSRVAIARMAPDVAKDLLQRVTRAVVFWKSRAAEQSGRTSIFAVGRLRLFLQLLSRLVSREDVPGSLAAFRIACGIASVNNLHHPWLLDHIDDLSNRSLASMPRAIAADMALKSLEIPLPASDFGPFRWPNPIRYLFNHGIAPRRPENDPRWRSAVATALDAAGGGGTRREHAIERLAYLSVNAVLTEVEKSDFADVLWRQVPADGDGLPDGVALFPHIVARLPAPAAVDADARARTALFERQIHEKQFEERLQSIVAAAVAEPPDTKMVPGPAQAVNLLDQVMTICPGEDVPKSSLGDGGRRRRVTTAAHAASLGLLPHLDPSDLDEKRIRYLMAVAEPGHGGNGLVGLPYLAAKRPDLLDEVSRKVRRALFRGDFRDVAGAARAVVLWMEEATCSRVGKLPDDLPASVVDAIASGRTGGLHPLLWCACRLFEGNQLTSAQVAGLRDSLGDLARETAYNNAPSAGPDAIGITLARANCVRLSRLLEKAGACDHRTKAWLEDADRDPLPEVRAAGADNDATEKT